MHPLTEARTARKMSLGGLAGASGVDRSTIYRIEEGHEPSVTKAIKLARAVDKSVEELWGELDRACAPVVRQSDTDSTGNNRN